MIKHNELTDNNLWNLITKDDQKAFKALFERYWSVVFTTAFNYLKDREACTEIVDDLFLNIWNKRQQLQIESFKAYLTASARYHVYKKLKAIKTSPLELVENYDSLHHKADDNYNIEDKIRSLELEKRVEIYLRDLPKRCREIFIMSRKEQLSNNEIAEKLKISKRTVENQLTYALKHLRLSLKHLSILLILLGI
jgi:RNA polymerase sigma-70 factor (family 1)